MTLTNILLLLILIAIIIHTILSSNNVGEAIRIYNKLYEIDLKIQRYTSKR